MHEPVADDDLCRYLAVPVTENIDFVRLLGLALEPADGPPAA